MTYCPWMETRKAYFLLVQATGSSTGEKREKGFHSSRSWSVAEATHSYPLNRLSGGHQGISGTIPIEASARLLIKSKILAYFRLVSPPIKFSINF